MKHEREWMDERMDRQQKVDQIVDKVTCAFIKASQILCKISRYRLYIKISSFVFHQ